MRFEVLWFIAYGHYNDPGKNNIALSSATFLSSLGPLYYASAIEYPKSLSQILALRKSDFKFVYRNRKGRMFFHPWLEHGLDVDVHWTWLNSLKKVLAKVS